MDVISVLVLIHECNSLLVTALLALVPKHCQDSSLCLSVAWIISTFPVKDYFHPDRVWRNQNVFITCT